MGRGVDARPQPAAGRAGTTHRARPHVEHLADGVLLRAPTLTYVEAGSDVLTGEVTCVVVGATTLTYETGQAAALEALEARLRAPGPEPDALTGGVLSSLLAVLVGAAADVEDALAQDVEDLERAVFSTTEARHVGRVYALKREIAEARRGLLPVGAEIADLVADPAGTRPEDAWARRLVVVVDRLDRRLDAHDALLADLLQAHLAMVSVRQNDDVRRISAWAAIAAAPTLVASVYGMNFRHMPELAQPWGYPVVLLAMLGVSVLLHRLFTRSGWL
nr:CorA family divalent cation transporter [Cellulomonas sp. APG4]